MDKAAAGRLGGLVTASRVDMRELGRRGGLVGGRPRNKTIEELMAKAQPLRLNISSGTTKTETGKVSKSLRVLKKQFLEKQSQMNITP